MKEITKVFQITVWDSGHVYKDIEDFAVEVRSMAAEYGLPADIVDIVDITSGAGVRGPLLPGGSRPPSSSEFHDVSGANVP